MEKDLKLKSKLFYHGDKSKRKMAVSVFQNSLIFFFTVHSYLVKKISFNINMTSTRETNFWKYNFEEVQIQFWECNFLEQID